MLAIAAMRRWLLVWRAVRFKARLIAAYLGAFALFVPWLITALDGALRKINAGVITGYHNSIPSTIPGVAQMIDILLGGQAALGLALIALVVMKDQRPAASDAPHPRPLSLGGARGEGQERFSTEHTEATERTEQKVLSMPPHPRPLSHAKRLPSVVASGARGEMPSITAGIFTQLFSRFPLPLITILASGVVMFVMVALVNLRVGIVSERTLSFMTPYIALTLGVGLAALSPRLRNVLTAALIAWAVLTPQHVIPRLNSDLAAQAVAEGYSPGDLVVLETGFDDMAFAYEMEIALRLKTGTVRLLEYASERCGDAGGAG